MGLLDVLKGMSNGPSGQRAGTTSSGGMSPLTMAVLGFLAYKGIKHLSSSGQTPSSTASSSPGGLGGLLGGGLGGLLSGGGLRNLLASGSGGPALSSGLGALLQQFQQSGQGKARITKGGRASSRERVTLASTRPWNG